MDDNRSSAFWRILHDLDLTIAQRCERDMKKDSSASFRKYPLTLYQRLLTSFSIHVDPDNSSPLSCEHAALYFTVKIAYSDLYRSHFLLYFKSVSIIHYDMDGLVIFS